MTLPCVWWNSRARNQYPITSQSHPTIEYIICPQCRGFMSNENKQDTIFRFVNSKESCVAISAVQLANELCQSTSEDLHQKQALDLQLGSIIQFMENQTFPEEHTKTVKCQDCETHNSTNYIIPCYRANQQLDLICDLGLGRSVIIVCCKKQTKYKNVC